MTSKREGGIDLSRGRFTCDLYDAKKIRLTEATGERPGPSEDTAISGSVRISRVELPILVGACIHRI